MSIHRRAAKVDGNQTEIVKALRSVGCSVQSLATVGDGCPDLLVGYRSANILLEVKDGSLSPSRRELTEDQEQWHSFWRGRVHIVTSVEEALFAVGANYRKRTVAMAGA